MTISAESVSAHATDNAADRLHAIARPPCGRAAARPLSPGPLWRDVSTGPVTAALFWRVQLFPGVLDLRDRLELDIGKSAVHLLDPAQIDVLDNVARLRIDRDRAARAFRVLPGLEKIHRFVGGELALCRLDHVEDRRHAVPAADREHVGDRLLGVDLVPGGEKRLVLWPGRRARIIAGADNAEREVALVRKFFVENDFRGGHDLNPASLDPRSDQA